MTPTDPNERARERVEGRLAERSYQAGDPIPRVGTMALVSGANCDVESDQHRSYGWRRVIGYSEDRMFVCLQTPGCWPTVERMENCWFAEVPDPEHALSHAAAVGGVRSMESAPRDGTMVRLLVRFDDHATEDTTGPAWTIGASNDDNVPEDQRIGWQFAGWCWTHDHFTEGKGTPVGWLPMLSDTTPQPAPAAVAGGELTELVDSLPPDEFRGDNAQLIASMEALISLDLRRALVPHGIGGHARGLLASAARRLAAQPAAGEAIHAALCFLGELEAVGNTKAAEIARGLRGAAAQRPGAGADSAALALAKRMYNASTDSDTIHCNRFPSWSELSEKTRREWYAKAEAKLSQPASEEG